MRSHGRWLVDGMNVIGARPDGWWRDRAGAMRRLAAQVGEWAEREGTQVTVVFDGRPLDPAPEVPGVEVRFAPGGPNAADRQIELLVAGVEPAETTVVTSDRDLEERVAALGARVVGAGSFRRELEE